MASRLLGAVALVVLVAMAGCTTLLGGGGADAGALAADPGVEYEWKTDADGHLRIYEDNYTAVYAVGNRSAGSLEPPYTFELFGQGTFGGDEPLELSSLQLRYENGTVLRYVQENGTANLVSEGDGGRTDVEDSLLQVNQTRERTVVTLPVNESAQLAFTAPKSGKSVRTAQFVSGSYVAVLPEDAAMGLPLLSDTSPSGARVSSVDGNLQVRWEGVSGQSAILADYYLERDVYLLGGLVGVTLLAVLVGGGYYFFQIRETVRKRQEVGLDVETDDDSGRGPF